MQKRLFAVTFVLLVSVGAVFSERVSGSTAGNESIHQIEMNATSHLASSSKGFKQWASLGMYISNASPFINMQMGSSDGTTTKRSVVFGIVPEESFTWNDDEQSLTLSVDVATLKIGSVYVLQCTQVGSDREECGYANLSMFSDTLVSITVTLAELSLRSGIFFGHHRNTNNENFHVRGEVIEGTASVEGSFFGAYAEDYPLPGAKSSWIHRRETHGVYTRGEAITPPGPIIFPGNSTISFPG